MRATTPREGAHRPARRARAPLRAALATAALLLASGAQAHLGNLSYADFAVRGSDVTMRFRYAAHVTPGWTGGEGAKVSRAELLALAGNVADWLADSASVETPAGPCRVSIENLIGPDRNDDLEVEAVWSCPESPVEAVRIVFEPLAGRVDGWQTIASIHLGEATSSTVFTHGAPRWTVGEFAAVGDGDEADDSDGSAWKRFFLLGVEHIWTGYDHLLFLLAVLLAGGGIGRLAAIVTSFTVAHSITLGAAATGLVALPVEPVEAAIALSIVYVALENIAGRGGDRRALVTFAFGLVHGFGFASVLAETALPPGEVVVPLLAFNLGVEAGQLAVVLVVVPVLAPTLRGPHAARVRIGLSALVALAGAAWAVERLSALL